MNRSGFVFWLVLSGISACVSPPPPGQAALSNNARDWRDEVIYQIMIDRFNDGDPSNNYNVNAFDPSAYHGGDWRGLQDRLDYLEELGVTALWISPVVRNVEEDAGFASYHGYWTQDFTRENPHFGDLSALREIVDAAHARGLKVILDVVTNHVGQAFYYDINKNGQPDEFLLGQGAPIGWFLPEHKSDLTRILEWDPDFNIDGIQAWTSLGPSGEAPIVFARVPKINRMPPQPEIFSQPYAYNRKGRVTVWSHPEVCQGVALSEEACRRRQEVYGDFPGGLKDIATTRADVRAALIDAFARWIDVGDFDGFRIDTLKHVEPEFWEAFCPAMRERAAERGKKSFYMFGEAFDYSPEMLGSYTQGQGVDSVFNFTFYYDSIRGGLKDKSQDDALTTCGMARPYCYRLGCPSDPCGGGSIASTYSALGKAQGPEAEDGALLTSRDLVVHFESNHDVGRLLYFMPKDWDERDRRSGLHLALGHILTTDGIPCLYYGVEQEFSGGNDPANRETLWDERFYQKLITHEDGSFQWVPRTYDADGDGEKETRWKPFDTGNPTFRFLARVIALRKAHVALRRGEFALRWVTTQGGHEDHGLFAFERLHPEENALVVLNMGFKDAHTERSGQPMTVSFAPGTTLVDWLDPALPAVEVTSSGCPAGPGEGCATVPVAAHSLRILGLPAR